MRTPKHFYRYLRLYGPHFTKELHDFAVSLMDDGNNKITPFTKQEIEQKLQQ
jgi:hypothetical protein